MIYLTQTKQSQNPPYPLPSNSVKTSLRLKTSKGCSSFNFYFLGTLSLLCLYLGYKAKNLWVTEGGQQDAVGLCVIILMILTFMMWVWGEIKAEFKLGKSQHSVNAPVRLEASKGCGSCGLYFLGILLLACLFLAYKARCLWVTEGSKQDGAGLYVLLFMILLFMMWVWCEIRVDLKLGKPIVQLRFNQLVMGEEFECLYTHKMKSNFDIETVNLALVCEELASYRSGTSTITVRHRVLEEQRILLKSEHVSSGQVIEFEEKFQIPVDAMHTFFADRNSIKWFIELKINVASLSTYQEEFPFEVLPQRLAQ